MLFLHRIADELHLLTTSDVGSCHQPNCAQQEKRRRRSDIAATATCKQRHLQRVSSKGRYSGSTAGSVGTEREEQYSHEEAAVPLHPSQRLFHTY